MSINDNQVKKQKNALVYAYGVKKGLSNPVDASQLGCQQTADDYQWAHLLCDTKDTASLLSSYQLEQPIIHALTANETRPRAAPLGKGILLVLRGISRHNEQVFEEMASLRIWFNSQFVVTTMMKSRTLPALAVIEGVVKDGTCPVSTNSFIVSIIEKVADDIGNSVDIIDEALARYETNLGIKTEKSTRAHLAAIRHKTISIRRYLAPQRDALETLLRVSSTLSDEESFGLKQLTDRITRYVEDLDLARERCVLLQETLRNMTSEQQNNRLYFLSIVTAIFLPLSFLTGLFGMNVSGLPGTENPNAFLYLSLAMGGLALVIILIMYWMKWLQSNK